MEKVNVYLLHIARVRGKEEILSLLPPERVQKALRFVAPRDRLLSIAAGYLAYRYIGETVVDKYGKPRAQGKYFGLSHSGDWAALAIAPDEVGLDIEERREDPDEEELAAACLCDDELAVYRTGVPFPALFTAKESLTKAEGRGLPDEIDAVAALPLDGKVVYHNKTYYRHAFRWDAYCGSVTVANTDFTIETEEVYVD